MWKFELTLGLAVGEHGDRDNSSGGGHGGLRLAVRGDGDGSSGGGSGSGAAGVGARDDVDVDQGALVGNVGVVQVVEATGLALVEVGGRAESDGAVLADGELSLVLATSLDGLVELELGVVGGNVTGAAVNVHQVSIVDQQGQDAGLAAGGGLAGAEVTVGQVGGLDDGDLEVAVVVGRAVGRGSTESSDRAGKGSEGESSLHCDCC